jgi:ABC-type transport system involved in multi-copper enzyme maturation permease subunit
MIWLTWRQFRVQALATLAAFALLAGYLVILGAQIRSSAAGVAPGSGSGLVKEYGSQVTGLGALLFGVPALIGIFWGAPLVAGEFEEGTHRLVWNQSITRTRWLAVKLALVGLAGLVVTSLFSLLLTWSTSRFDQLKDERFAALTFGARGIAPIGYAVFAFTLATVVGLMLRRTMPAMVITLVVFGVIQLLVPNALRAHYMPAKTTSVAFSTEARELAVGVDSSSTPALITGYRSPGTWAISRSTEILTADGTPVDGSALRACQQPANGPQAKNECLDKLGLHFDYTYQPASRYWPFQLIELSIFLALSALVTWLGFRRIGRS